MQSLRNSVRDALVHASRARTAVLVAVAYLCVARSYAIPSVSLDILSEGDPGYPPPPGLVIVDVFVDVDDTDYFMAGAISAVAINGAQFRYNPDPNSTPFLPPGTGERFVTFGSAAYGRNSNARFAPAGTLQQQSIILTTGYIPGTPAPNLQHYAVNTVFLVTPLPGNPDDPAVPRGRDGYVMRLALDISDVDLPGGDDPARYAIFPIGAAPAGFQPVILSQGDPVSPGVAVTTRESSGLFGTRWGLYVPEPQSLLLFGMGFWIFRRRVGID